jgi:hypothetical protein
MNTPSPKQAKILAKHPGAIAWCGGDCPVDPDSKPAVFMGVYGPTDFCTASCWNWRIGNDDDGIIAYIPDPEFAALPETVSQHCPNCEAIKRPTRQEARDMLAKVLINYPTHLLRRDMFIDAPPFILETEPSVKAILDAIAGEE